MIYSLLNNVDKTSFRLSKVGQAEHARYTAIIRRIITMPFKKQLAMYASYHQDRRNIATHMVGIPLIVLGPVNTNSVPLLEVIFTIN